jgi:hypothetical protein
MEDREVKDGLIGRGCYRDDQEQHDTDEDDEDKISGISSDLFWVDINPVNNERHRLVTDAIRETGIRPTDDVFERHYLNAQFKSNGDIHGVIEKPLEAMWERFISTFFKLGDPVYHKVGTRMEAHLSVATQWRFVVPFIRLYLGVEDTPLELQEFVTHNLRWGEDVEEIFTNRYHSIVVHQCRTTIQKKIRQLKSVDKNVG